VHVRAALSTFEPIARFSDLATLFNFLQSVTLELLLGSGLQATMEAMLQAVFSTLSAPRLYQLTDRIQFS
jgi:hypothetical protein